MALIRDVGAGTAAEQPSDPEPWRLVTSRPKVRRGHWLVASTAAAAEKVPRARVEALLFQPLHDGLDV